MNVRLLKQVRDYIKDHPDEYDQDQWCGTQFCIAGHILSLSGTVPDDLLRGEDDSRLRSYLRSHFTRAEEGVFSGPAAELLDISEGEATSLFLNWPKRYEDAMRYASAEEKPAVAVDRIDHFIKTKGAE
jgi:hypothetical protein